MPIHTPQRAALINARNWRTRLPIPHVNILGRQFSPNRLEDYYYSAVQDNAMYMTYIHEAGPRPPPRHIRLTHDPENPYSKYPLTHLKPSRAELTGETKKQAGRHKVGGVQVVYGKKSVGGWIRPNIPVGTKVELKGAPMYDFLAQLVEFVLPRLKDFPGVMLPPPSASEQSPSAVSGVVTMGLDPQALAFFPQIEVNVDSYPKSYGMHIPLGVERRNGRRQTPTGVVDDPSPRVLYALEYSPQLGPPQTQKQDVQFGGMLSTARLCESSRSKPATAAGSVAARVGEAISLLGLISFFGHLLGVFNFGISNWWIYDPLLGANAVTTASARSPPALELSAPQRPGPTGNHDDYS
ncbi:60S ribosomal protein L7 [Mycena chlorophos]|uniref:60S ribosomal protein L7 n=1 Tax=Mycena chlorophos TaxID=658473 RepID=A0A8H6SAJ9_MYCCL|nr:60S ribosomal protein L7 [Mycena chlorophos]